MAWRSVIVRHESCWEHLSVENELEPLPVVGVTDDFLNKDEAAVGFETSSLWNNLNQ